MLCLPLFANLTWELFHRSRRIRNKDIVRGAAAWSAMVKGLDPPDASQPPADETRHSLTELLSAFAEIASLKQLVEVEQFLDSRWQSLQDALAQIASSRGVADAAMTLVNHCRTILVATCSRWLSQAL